MISLWKQAQKGEEITEELAYTIAKRRCLSLLETGHTTGHERVVIDASRVVVQSLEAIVTGDTDRYRLSEDHDPTPDLDLVADVRAAIKTLPPKVREYVFHRFYMEQDQRGLAEATGYTDSGNRKNWANKYKPQVGALLKGIPYVA